MSAGRVLKAIAVAGGGILAVGTGAVGTHLSYPFLEQKFFPQRLDEEQKTKESLNDSQKKLDVLAGLVDSQQHTSERQIEKISSLNENLEDIRDQLSQKNTTLSQKTQELEERTKELQIKKDKYSEQQSTISTFTSNLATTNRNLSKVKQEKDQIQNNLDGTKAKLALTREQILSEEALKLDSLDVNLRKITRKSYNGTHAEFEIVESGGATTSFKLKNSHFPKHEEIAKHIREKGITFSVDDSSFSSWNKQIKITRFDVHYSYKPTNLENKSKYVKEDSSKVEQTISLTNYFQQSYLKDAFKILIAITSLDFLPIDYNWPTSSEHLFNFREGFVFGQDFYTTDNQVWSGFSSSEGFNFYLSRFETINDFLKYWTSRTVDFVKTGRVDLLELLNPILLSKNYKNSA